MGLYRWVRALDRFAKNVHRAVAPVLKILDDIEMLLVRIIVFAGFLYGVYALAHGH